MPAPPMLTSTTGSCARLWSGRFQVRPLGEQPREGFTGQMPVRACRRGYPSRCVTWGSVNLPGLFGVFPFRDAIRRIVSATPHPVAACGTDRSFWADGRGRFPRAEFAVPQHQNGFMRL